MTTRVVIVDDHPLFRSGLAGLIGTIPGLVVSGSFGTAEEAVSAVAANPAEVVLMDLSLPGASGVEATRAILAARPETAILVITMVDDDDSVFAAVSAGARGYVLKGAPAAEIAAAIHTVAAGGAVFGAELAARLLARRPVDRVSMATPGGDLTPRELEILGLLGSGASNQQIARSLGLSVKTVQNHVSRILDKLHAADRTSAALKARGLQP